MTFFQFLKIQIFILSFFQLFSDFLLKNGAIFDCFCVIFVFFIYFQPPLLIRFSDAEIPIVHWLVHKAQMGVKSEKSAN